MPSKKPAKKSPLFTKVQLSMLLSEAAGPGLKAHGYNPDRSRAGHACILQAAFNTERTNTAREFDPKGASSRYRRALTLQTAFDREELDLTSDGLLKACEEA